MCASAARKQCRRRCACPEKHSALPIPHGLGLGPVRVRLHVTRARTHRHAHNWTQCNEAVTECFNDCLDKVRPCRWPMPSARVSCIVRKPSVSRLRIASRANCAHTCSARASAYMYTHVHVPYACPSRTAHREGRVRVLATHRPAPTLCTPKGVCTPFASSHCRGRAARRPAR